MENFGTQAGQAPHRALWNYNLAKQSQSVFLNLATAGIPEGVDVPQGTLLDVDLQTREASIVKNALVVAGGTTSAPRVAKGHFFKAGDFVFVTGDAVAVSSVDTTNADYDVLTLSGACTGATAGNYIEQAKASGVHDARKFPGIEAPHGLDYYIQILENADENDMSEDVLNKVRLLKGESLPFASMIKLLSNCDRSNLTPEQELFYEEVLKSAVVHGIEL